MGGNRSVCEISTSDSLFHGYSHITSCKPQALPIAPSKLEGCTKGKRSKELDGTAAAGSSASTVPSLASLLNGGRSQKNTKSKKSLAREEADVHTIGDSAGHADHEELGESRSRRSSGGLSVAELTQEESRTEAISKKELHEWFGVGQKRSAEDAVPLQSKSLQSGGQEGAEDAGRPLKKFLSASEGATTVSDAPVKLEASSSSTYSMLKDVRWERKGQPFEFLKAEEAAAASMPSNWNPRPSFGSDPASMASYGMSASLAHQRFHMQGMGFSQFQGTSSFPSPHSQEQQAYAMRGGQGHVSYGVPELGQMLPMQQSLTGPAVRSMQMPWISSQFLHPQSFSYGSTGGAPMAMANGPVREDVFVSRPLPFSMWQDSAVSFQAPPLSSTTQLPKDSAQQELGRHSKYCHFCQHVKSTMAACSSPQCTFKFCHNCISVHLMEDWDAVLRAERDKSWKCPCCRYRCCCCSSKACTAKHPHCKAYRKRQQTRVNVVEGGE